MKLRVTIVGLKCFDHLAGASTPRYLGGIETQLVVLARALAAAGCAVTLVCYNHGQPETSIDGIEVVNAFAPEAAVSPLGKLRAALTLRAAIRRTQPDVVLQMGAGAETGWTAWSCGTTPFVFCMASDANFGAHLRAGRFGLEGRIYRFGLRRARLIIAQTRRQHDGMLAALGLDSKIIGMAASPSPATASSSRQPASREILWIGRIIPGKRLEWLIEAAPHCPGLMFHVVGSPNRGSDYARNVMASAARLPNIKVHGRLNEAELGELYARVSFLCCTSQLEGFPTTFL
jgi:glycosyltransferase involved in cell wall biosynthesis